MQTKRRYLFVLAAMLLLLVSACSTGNTNGAASQTPRQTASSTLASETVQTTSPDAAKNSQTVLVVFFSQTGHTKKLAEYAADALSANLYEIVPQTPYTDADLNYNDSNSRSSTEMSDAAARPAITGSVENMKEYDIVFLAYPIWFSEAPRVVSTFMESHDFSGKTIVPFCTSGSSGIGSSATNLHALCSTSVNWMDGERFAAGATRADMVKWINGLNLNLTAQ